MENLLGYSWILILIVAVVLYKYILRFLFGMVIVPEDRVGLVTKRFILFGENKELPDGRIIATRGEAGFQAKTLAPGIYFGKWVWQFDITMENFTIIPEGKIGLVMAKDGSEIPTGNILGERVECDNLALHDFGWKSLPRILKTSRCHTDECRYPYRKKTAPIRFQWLPTYVGMTKISN